MVNNVIMKDKLIKTAIEYRKKSYSPYSNFAVGAAVLTEENEIYGGCNIENSSYGATICAERVAITKAVSEGAKKIKAIALLGAPDGEEPRDYCTPCGICRQFLCEFADKDASVILVKNEKDFKEYTLDEILPFSFTKDSM